MTTTWYSVSVEEWWPAERGSWRRPFFVINRLGKRLVTAVVVINARDGFDLLRRTGHPEIRSPGDGETVEERVAREEANAAPLKRVLLRYGTRRLEQLCVENSVTLPNEYTTETLQIIVDNDELAYVARLLQVKSCDYQLREGRDVYCTAADPNDETRIGSIGIRGVAPTSTPICLACDLPDTDFLCSHLMHPTVTGVRTMGGYHSRLLLAPLCISGDPRLTTRSSATWVATHAQSAS